MGKDFMALDYCGVMPGIFNMVGADCAEVHGAKKWIPHGCSLGCIVCCINSAKRPGKMMGRLLHRALPGKQHNSLAKMIVPGRLAAPESNLS